MINHVDIFGTSRNAAFFLPCEVERDLPQTTYRNYKKAVSIRLLLTKTLYPAIDMTSVKRAEHRNLNSSKIISRKILLSKETCNFARSS